MRTEKEVNDYLRGFALKSNDVDFILGFLCAKEIKPCEFYSTKSGISFKEFVEWFNNDSDSKFSDDEFSKGDFIHVEDEMDVLVLSELQDGKFVGTNGTIIHQYELTKGSRPCFEEEILNVEKKLEENGILFCYECDELEPLIEEIDDNDKETSDDIDELEVQCKDAIENIMANIHEGKLSTIELKSIIEAMNALVVLGSLYE